MGARLARQKLFSSIDANNLEDVRIVLSKYPNLVNEFFDNKSVSFPLLRAAWKGQKDMIQLLVEKGADPLKKNAGGTDVLLLCAARGHSLVVEQVLGMGVPIDSIDNKGFSALDHAIIRGFYNTGLLLVALGSLKGTPMQERGVLQKC